MKYKEFNIALRWSCTSLALVWVAGCIFATTSISFGDYYRVFGFWVANRAWEGSVDWVADRWELGLLGLLLTYLVFIIVDSIGRVALGQPENSTLNRFLRVTSKLAIVATLIYGAALPIYDMNRTLLDEANEAFLYGDKGKAYKLYGKAIKPGLDMKDLAICNSGTTTDIRACGYILAGIEEKEIEELTFPKVTDHIWTINKINISPLCMETEWISGDNYEGYEELYPKAKNFTNYPGRYFGDLVSIEPVRAPWDESLNLALAQPIESCNKILEKDTIKFEKNVFIHNSPERYEDMNDYSGYEYKLIAEWEEKECSKLLPHFAGRCQSLVFVKVDKTYRFPEISFNSYAHITDKGKAYIVPVTNHMHLKELLKLIDNN